MLSDVCLVIQLDVAKYLIHTEDARHIRYRSRCQQLMIQETDLCLANLHADDCVDEEEHGDEQADVGQGLEGLDESPQENADGVTLSEQFDQASGSEQLQETHVELINRLAQGERRKAVVY